MRNLTFAKTLLICILLTVFNTSVAQKTSVMQKTSLKFSNMAHDIQVRTYNLQGQSALETMSIAEAMSFHKVEGVAIVTIVDGEIETVYHKGYRNKQERKKVDDNTIFSVASLSKLPAALAMVKAARTGDGPKLGRVVGKIAASHRGSDLDDWYKTRSKTFWSDRTGSPYGPSIQRLLSHTAGLTRHGVGISLDGCVTDMASVLLGSKDCDEEATNPYAIPGTLWDYSGGGYIVAEAALEATTRGPSVHYLTAEILYDYGMERSTYDRASPSMDNLARACFDSGSLPCTVDTPYTHVKFAGGLLAHPEDYAHLLALIMNDGRDKSGARVIEMADIEDILTPTWHRDSSLKSCSINANCPVSGENCFTRKCRKVLIDDGQRYGLGVELQNTVHNALIREFQHNGSQPGVATRFYADRKTQNAIVILSTGNNKFPGLGFSPTSSELPGAEEFTVDMLEAWKRYYQ